MTRRPPLVSTARRPGGGPELFAPQRGPACTPRSEICPKQGMSGMRTDHLPIDAQGLDQIVAAARPELLWGLPSIARAMGVSIDTARRLARNPGKNAPIYCPGGRYFALRSELVDWMKQRVPRGHLLEGSRLLVCEESEARPITR
jgi:hypothetical protein